MGAALLRSALLRSLSPALLLALLPAALGAQAAPPEAGAALPAGGAPPAVVEPAPAPAAPLAVATPAPTPPLVAEPTVRAVELLADAAVDRPAEVLEMVTLHPGAPYDEQQVRRTLRNLRSSGIAAEVEVWTRDAGPGAVDVVVAMWTNVLVEKVEILGQDLGLARDTLRRDLEVQEGEPLLEDRVLRTVFRLQDRLRGEGYFEGSVRARVALDAARKRARVGFEVAAGPRARIGTLSIAGPHGPFTDAQLAAQLRARPGQLYRQSQVRDDAERLRRWLHEQGYRQAEIELVAERYEPADHQVALDYHLDAHGLFTMSVEGADAKELERKDLLPFLGDEGYDEAVVLQSVERIRRWYQERGHYHVRVEHAEERRGEDVHLRLTVEPGPLYTLREVRFTGNEEVSAEKLSALMTTTGRRLLVAGSGRLIDDVLAADLENVRAYYALSGWTEAKVGPVAITERDRALSLAVPVVEGPRSRVVELRIEGVRSLDEAALRRELPLRPSGPFHPRLLDETLDTVRAHYEQQGYPSAQVSASTEWTPDHTLVDVTLRVLEGPRQVAANVLVRGNRKTDTDVIRLLAGVQPGEPLSRRRLLDIQRNLYSVGVFTRVDVTLPPAGDSVRERDVLIEVEEASDRRIAWGVGYDSEDGPGGLLSYSHPNVAGRALHLQAEARGSTRTERFRLLLTQPYWRNVAGSINYLIYKEGDRRQTFDSDQFGVQTELAQTRGRWRYSLFGDLRRVDLAPGDENLDITSLPPDEQRALTEVRILSLTPRVVWDERDDPLDPHRGSQLVAQLKYAFPAGQVADQHFLQLFSQFVHLWNLKQAGVLALSLRGGAIEQLGAEDVAISELFFAGGRTSHRAYERDLLGIPGQTLIEGDPIGGRGLFLANLDYRFPIAGGLGGTLFADAGNVWLDWRDMRWEEIKPGLGAGLRYLTPVGPLRVEVGWKLDREPGEPGSVVLVSFGNAF